MFLLTTSTVISEAILQYCLIPILGTITSFLVMFIKKKINEIQLKINNENINKYLSLLENTIVTCVSATNQTYVASLKDKNLFDEKAQAEAFDKTYNAILATLTEDSKKYLAMATGDLEGFIKNKIESIIASKK